MRQINLLFILLVISLSSPAQTNRERRMAAMHLADMNYTESFKDYMNLARYENSNDLNTLAYHYQYGKGTDRDQKKAMEYYRMAADRGDKDSQCELACYFDDDDLTDARQKADLYRYSLMYATNLEHSSSTSSDDDQALYAVYKCYKNGWGTDANTTLADMWLTYAVYSECSEAIDLYNELYGLEKLYDSEEESDEIAYFSGIIRHLYETVAPYIGNDDSIESRFFTSYARLLSVTADDAVSVMDAISSLYEDEDLTLPGKAYVFSTLIQPLIQYYPDFGKYQDDADNYYSVSEEETSTWLHEQMVKMMWKMDVKIRNRNMTTSNSEMVDLALPSGTLWSFRNLGASDPSDIGELYAWGEKTPRDRFSEKNYTAPKALLWSDDIDPSIMSDADWRMPNWYDWRELLSYCRAIPDYDQRRVFLEGPNGNFIVLPMTDEKKIGAEYWTQNASSYLYDATDKDAVGFGVNLLPDWGFFAVDRWKGLPVRPVKKYDGYK